LKNRRRFNWGLMFDICEAIALQQNDFAAAQDGERYSRNLMGHHLLFDEAINFSFREAIVPAYLLTETRKRNHGDAEDTEDAQRRL